MYSYAQISHGRDNGSSYAANFRIAQRQGIDDQQWYWQGNFDYTTQPDAKEHHDANNWVLRGYTQLPATRLGIERAIASNHPASIAIPVTWDFTNNRSGVYPSNVAGRDHSKVRGSHAITALAYNSTGVTIENSWGPFWDKGGYVTIRWSWLNRQTQGCPNLMEVWQTNGMYHRF